ncbi:MAG: hypothetical protein Q9O62_06490 [Ardenticatenia bacterium]|nr:hypothetical protein [Ardenticatenia bacterium]
MEPFKTYVPEEVIVSPRVRVRRERMLRSLGQLFVRIGQLVHPHDVVAKGPGHTTIHLVDVAAELKLKPKAALKAILVEPGQTVKAEELLARQSGLFHRKELRAPVDGRVMQIDPLGRVVLQVMAEGETLRAGLQGKVINLMPRHGVVIESVGAFVQGVWGNGRSHVGILRLLASSPDDQVSPEQFDVSVRGSIVVVGRTASADVFEAAARARVHGLIMASLRPELLDVAQQQDYAVVVTEGVVGAAMAPPIFDILRRHDGHEAVVHAVFSPARPRLRPDILIPLQVEDAPLFHAGRPLATGDVVRLLAPPLLGKVGTVRDPWVGLGMLESGVEAEGCEVELADGSVHFVPLHAVERLTGAERLGEEEEPSEI